MSDSVRPHRRQPTRLPRPWDSPGKNTGGGCHFLLQCMKGKSESEVAQSCPTPRDPMDCSLPGSSVHGIFQARVLEWGAIAFSVSYAIPCFILYWVTHLKSHFAIQLCRQDKIFYYHFIDAEMLQWCLMKVKLELGLVCHCVDSIKYIFGGRVKTRMLLPIGNVSYCFSVIQYALK